MSNYYERYLNLIDKKVEGFFEQQAPYIKCKKGCSYCCESGSYPITELEFKYMRLGFSKLDRVKQTLVLQNIRKIKQGRNDNEDEFLYQCPFLIDKICCIYEYRGLICRVFGLPYFDKNDKLKLPACIGIGLNYAEVLDEEKKMLSMEKVEKLGFSVTPVAFNLSLDTLLNNEAVKTLNLNFGEQKMLVDWF
ncbi:MAG: YkgJ family cysteine cluster protein [Candidatus Gastranaerophilales bacterium]|nr:YkgJ family cysteine cluster protein [Candidatus Gastranaerophilales bacterium]